MWRCCDGDRWRSRWFCNPNTLGCGNRVCDGKMSRKASRRRLVIARFTIVDGDIWSRMPDRLIRYKVVNRVIYLECEATKQNKGPVIIIAVCPATGHFPMFLKGIKRILKARDMKAFA